MLQVARLSPKLLGDSAALVGEFLRSRLNPDGGFQDRNGASDLYYTVFGLEGLIALGLDPPPAVRGYLGSFGNGEDLDLVHLSCLVRCWASLDRKNLPIDVQAVATAIESHRSADGGYHTARGEGEGSAYGCFLAVAAHQDLRLDIPNSAGILRCLRRLRAADGGYANQRGLATGLTPSTASASVLFRQLDEEPPAELSAWLLSRCHKEGGFFAAPSAPIPDLLSTATALHALAGMKADIAPIKEACLDFIDSLWTSAGGFYGNWADEALDCEYTYYGLLSLGHLSL
jgi:prenyltransferase beta subunit